MARILGVGIATLDIINTVDGYPAEDSEVRAIHQRICRGGNATNTLVVLSQLGHRCAWAGVLADEPDGLDDGALDGAMKFVKGDAIAALLILGVNIVAGFALGMISHGMSAAEAGEAYVTLAVGDALVAQVPALLLSIAVDQASARLRRTSAS